MFEIFRPRLLDTLRGYNRKLFTADLTAGLTVGIVALPLAIAFAIASGVKPEAGLTTAIIAGFIISAFGGSRVQIGGPTGAFIVIVYGIVVQYGLANLLICTIMAGVMLLLMGVFKFGSLVHYIPRPLVLGFTNGIAVLIALSEVKDFLGLKIDTLPAEFSHKIVALFHALPTVNFISLLLAVACTLFIVFYPRAWVQRLPAPIVALVLATGIVALFGLPVETIGSKFGGIPQGLPTFDMPKFTFSTLHNLFPPALTIALLGAIESLLSATVADGMIDDRHDPNQELMAQGIANIITPFFGGIPATGAIARTATNVRAGANSPIAGIVHALTLLVIVLIAAPLAKHIPLAALAAILMVVAFNMGEWSVFTTLRKYPASDSAVLVITFILTVVFDLTVAVEVGMVLAVLFFIRRITDLTRVSEAFETPASGQIDTPARMPTPPGVLVYRVFGALFFGAADKLESILHQQRRDPEVLILQLEGVISMDASALYALNNLHAKLNKAGGHLVLCGAHTQPFLLMHQAGFLDELGRENITGSLDAALARAQALMQEKQVVHPAA